MTIQIEDEEILLWSNTFFS